MVVYKGTKLSTYFQTKDNTEKERNNVVYNVLNKCADIACSDSNLLKFSKDKLTTGPGIIQSTV